jgi:hypothetical protein
MKKTKTKGKIKEGLCSKIETKQAKRLKIETKQGKGPKIETKGVYTSIKKETSNTSKKENQQQRIHTNRKRTSGDLCTR